MGRNFIVEKSDQHYISQVIKVNMNNYKSRQYYIRDNVMRNGSLTSVVRKVLVERHFTKRMTKTP